MSGNEGESDEDEADSDDTILEVFDKQKFIDFIYHKQKPYDGILQKFVEPKGEVNSMIKLIWSPNLCLFERRENEVVPLRGQVLGEKLVKIGCGVAQHISNVTYDKIRISRMVLNFRVDKNDKVWFLWCSSLRSYNENDKYKGEGPLKKKMHVNPVNLNDGMKMLGYKENQSSIKNQPSEQNTLQEKCLSCYSRVSSSRMYSISYNLIIDDHKTRGYPKEVLKYNPGKYDSDPKELKVQ